MTGLVSTFESQRLVPEPEGLRASEPIRFSDGLLIAVLLAKPAADAFYNFGAVKYAYMALLLFAAFVAYIGRRLGGVPGLGPVQARYHLQHLGGACAYLVFLLAGMAVFMGSFNEVFKIISPFVLFVVVMPLLGDWFVKVLGVGSLLVILSNAALMPLDFGWTQWGGARTFKGFYFFKTDLAYAITFATLSVALWQRFRFTPVLLMAALLAAIQVILSNSRLNYLLFGVVAVFICFKGGLRLATLVRAGALLGSTALAGALLFDSSKMLGFDTSNLGGFTQGRNHIWDVMLDEALASFSPAKWVFGGGLFADMLLFAESSTTGAVHNAHNEWLHLLLTQGLFGVLLYLYLWFSMFRFATAQPVPPWSRGVATLAMALILLQSLTAVVSSTATKTWPVVLILMAVAKSASARGTPK